MFHLSRFQLGCIFVALMLLRVAVGFHFFQEGTAKLRDGFTAQPFFAAARGPLVPFFRSLIDDPDGRLKLCATTSNETSNAPLPQLDPELSFLIWDDFLDRATSYYQFGDVGLMEQTPAQTIQMIASQPDKAEEILQIHRELLADFLDRNRTALVAHFAASERVAGFEKDGDSRIAVAAGVDALGGQIDTIAADRKKQLQQWSTEVVAIWDSLEQQINSLAVDVQAEKPTLTIHRPFVRQPNPLKMIDQSIPWFDTIVGALLILGLLSRIASGAAAIFLISVIATQPPLVRGAAPTYFYFIELAACLVICATAAGRFGGLDFFFSRRPKPTTD